MTSNITQYYKSYFPERNGVIPKLEINKNFTEETLKYMMKPKTASYISNLLEEFTGQVPYFVIEGGAGIGGNTLEFLARSKVATVMTFEKNEERANILKRNIMAYGFGERAIVMNNEMNSSIGFDSYKNAIFYFDPPWVKNNLKIGDLTPEEWLEKLRGIAYLVAFRMHSEFELRPIGGWSYYQESINIRNMNNGKLIICIPNSNLTGELGVDVSKDEILANLKPLDPALGNMFTNFVTKCSKKPFKEAINDSVCKRFVKYSYMEEKLNKITTLQGVVKKTSDFSSEETDNIEKATMGSIPLTDQVHIFNDMPKPSKDLDPNSAEWAAEFSVYLKTVLGKFLDEDKCNQLVGPENMHYWFQAFTHETYNRNDTENYESLEYFGDTISGAAFTLFIFEKTNGQISKGALTSYHNVYMSQTFQTLVGSKTFGFTYWLRANIDKTPKMNEDIFEAFVGALHQAGDNCRKGWGFYICRLFINYICEKVVLSDEDAKGDYKQRANQNMQRIGLGGQFKYVDHKNADGTWIIKYTLNSIAISRIRQLGFDVPDDGVMGIGVSTKKSQGELTAAIKAVKKFEEIGMNQKFFDDYQQNRELSNLKKENFELYQLVNDKLVEDGYKDTYQFKTNVSRSNNKDFYTVQLTAINIKNKTVILGEGKDENKLEAIIKAAEQYINTI